MMPEAPVLENWLCLLLSSSITELTGCHRPQGSAYRTMRSHRIVARTRDQPGSVLPGLLRLATAAAFLFPMHAQTCHQQQLFIPRGRAWL